MVRGDGQTIPWAFARECAICPNFPQWAWKIFVSHGRRACQVRSWCIDPRSRRSLRNPMIGCERWGLPTRRCKICRLPWWPWCGEIRVWTSRYCNLFSLVCERCNIHNLVWAARRCARRAWYPLWRHVWRRASTRVWVLGWAWSMGLWCVCCHART